MIWKKKKKDFDHLVNVPLNKMYVIIIYWWCTSSVIYKLNFCYMLKGIQESNFCNNIQGFQCHFSQLTGAMLNVECWMLNFFLILLKFCCLTPKQLWFCINQNKYVICLQSNIDCITPSHISPAAKIKMLNFQCLYNHHSNGNHP